GTSSREFSLARQGQPAYKGSEGEILFLLEKDITVELQRRRSDLFFLHSAAVDWRGSACLLAAESGSGKSTTAWGLLLHDFHLLSDELSPIDLGPMEVLPYPHALCLKTPPAPTYRLPAGSLDRGRTIHIPTWSLPSATVSEPRPIGAVFLLTRRL